MPKTLEELRTKASYQLADDCTCVHETVAEKILDRFLELQNAEMTPMSSLDSDIGCWTAFGINSKKGPSPGVCVCDTGYAFNKAADTCILDLSDKKAEVDAAILAGYAVVSGPVERTAEGGVPSLFVYSWQ